MANCLTADFVRKQYVGESMYPLPGWGQYRWYYLSCQTRDEVLMLKMYDSDKDVRARCKFKRRLGSRFPDQLVAQRLVPLTDPINPYCPHAAFSIPDNQAGAAPRESIDVRVLFFGP